MPLVTILARAMRLKESLCQSREYVARVAGHDFGARNAIENCLKSTKL